MALAVARARIAHDLRWGRGAQEVAYGHNAELRGFRFLG